MRTDVVGGEKFADKATFVLVDAENASAEGAYVTLGGELTGEGGAKIGVLKAQSLWVPAHDTRMFALVDLARDARPGATSARVTIQGAVIPDEPPRAHVEELHAFDDDGKVVVQGYVVNAAERIGQVMVVGAFHDAHGQPMTRPFQMMQLGPHDKQVVQFVGPKGSSKGTIFVGEAIY